MSRVWLCQDPLAEQPYIVNKNISLYSFEELCYYLFQNAESVEESCFPGLLPLTCSPSFPKDLRTTKPRVVPLTMVWKLPHQPLIRKMPYRLVYRLILWTDFIN